MCSINHDLKALFIHIPKTAGIYIRSTLEKYYDFDLFLLKRPDHKEYCKTNIKLNEEHKLSFCCNKGVIQYYSTSEDLNELMDMDDKKWNTYTKFCVVRNPYEKAISAWNYLMETQKLNIEFDKYLKFKDIVSENEYWHLFLSQYENMIDSNGKMLVDLDNIIKFEKLEEDFERILKKIGVKEMIHNKDKVKNSRPHGYYKEYYNQESLNTINKIYEKDFELFGYKKYDNIDDFMNLKII